MQVLPQRPWPPSAARTPPLETLLTQSKGRPACLLACLLCVPRECESHSWSQPAKARQAAERLPDTNHTRAHERTNARTSQCHMVGGDGRSVSFFGPFLSVLVENCSFRVAFLDFQSVISRHGHEGLFQSVKQHKFQQQKTKHSHLCMQRFANLVFLFQIVFFFLSFFPIFLSSHFQFGCIHHKSIPPSFSTFKIHARYPAAARDEGGGDK